LIVIPGLGAGGGSERSTLELVPRLVDAGIDVSIAFMVHRETENREQLERAGARLHHIAPRSLQGRIRAIRGVLGSYRPDVVHTVLFEADLAGRLAAWRAPGCSPVVLSSIVNTSYDPARLGDPNVRAWKLRAVRLVDGWTARNLTNYFHAVSHAVKDSAVQALGIDPHRVTVIERGRDRGRLGDPSFERRIRGRSRLGLEPDAAVIVTVGRQEFQKGQVHLVRAFDAFAGVRPRAELLIVGRNGNHSAQLEARVRQSPYRERIRTLGHRDDVPDILAAADLFVLPSIYEGFPGAVIEAMALALPVIASSIPPLREVVEEGGSGLLVPSRDPARLAEAIGRVLDDPKLARRLGDRGRELFLTRLTAEQSHRRMIELYEQLSVS
jgi:glycosyltransferase involved in cell wall biosynthesis